MKRLALRGWTSSVVLCAIFVTGAHMAQAVGDVWTSDGPRGETVFALAVTPTILYAGTIDQGVLRSTDGGMTWSGARAGLPATSVGALVIDPATFTIYAGTGDSGAFKSTDGGDTWTAINTGLGDTTWVYALAIDHTGTLYAGALGPAPGLYKSTNGGSSWSATTLGGGVLAIAIDPRTRCTLYAGPGPGPGGVFKSTDCGSTWNPTGLTGTAPYAIALDPITPSTLYAGNAEGSVFKSTDAGVTWHAMNTGLMDSPVRAIAVDTNTPPALYIATSGAGVFKSTDGGSSWSALNAGLTIPVAVAALVFEPATDTLYAGTEHDGVFSNHQPLLCSGDCINIWKGRGLDALFIADLAIDRATPTTVYAGTSSGVFKSTDSGASWSHVLDAGRLVAIDPQNSRTIYAYSDHLSKTTDAGGTWTDFTSFVPGVETMVVHGPIYLGGFAGLSESTDGGESFTDIGGGTLADQEVHAILPDIPLYGTDTGIYFDRSFLLDTRALAETPVTVPPRPGTIYLSSFSCVYARRQGAGDWTLIGCPGTDVQTIVVEPRGTLYAGTHRTGVFKYGGTGDAWSAFNTGLGTLDVRVLAVEPTFPYTIYAGTAAGVYSIQQLVFCAGDCNGDTTVTIDELLTLVNIALGNPGSCPSGVPAGATVDISRIIAAVNNALNGCGG